MNQSPYKVSGKARRALKKELSLIKWCLKDFWRDDMIERDLYEIHGDTPPWDKAQALKRYNQMTLKAEGMEAKLKASK